jgi:exonuclease-1
MNNVDELLRYGITPYVVFDGGPLPMKKGTELERRKYVLQFGLESIISIPR